MHEYINRYTRQTHIYGVNLYEKCKQAVVWFGLLRFAEFVSNSVSIQLAVSVNELPFYVMSRRPP